MFASMSISQYTGRIELVCRDIIHNLPSYAYGPIKINPTELQISGYPIQLNPRELLVGVSTPAPDSPVSGYPVQSWTFSTAGGT